MTTPNKPWVFIYDLPANPLGSSLLIQLQWLPHSRREKTIYGTRLHTNPPQNHPPNLDESLHCRPSSVLRGRDTAPASRSDRSGSRFPVSRPVTRSRRPTVSSQARPVLTSSTSTSRRPILNDEDTWKKTTKIREVSFKRGEAIASIVSSFYFGVNRKLVSMY